MEISFFRRTVDDHLRVGLSQLFLADLKSLVPQPVANTAASEQTVMISGYDEVKFLKLLFSQIQPVAVFYDIGLHAQLDVEFGIFHIHSLNIISHVDDLVPVDPVEQMSRSVIRDRNKLQALVEGFSYIIFDASFAVGIGRMCMQIVQQFIILCRLILFFSNDPYLRFQYHSESFQRRSPGSSS